jgi:hypothetical protein
MSSGAVRKRWFRGWCRCRVPGEGLLDRQLLLRRKRKRLMHLLSQGPEPLRTFKHQEGVSLFYQLAQGSFPQFEMEITKRQVKPTTHIFGACSLAQGK